MTSSDTVIMVGPSGRIRVPLDEVERWQKRAYMISSRQEEQPEPEPDLFDEYDDDEDD